MVNLLNEFRLTKRSVAIVMRRGLLALFALISLSSVAGADVFATTGADLDTAWSYFLDGNTYQTVESDNAFKDYFTYDTLAYINQLELKRGQYVIEFRSYAFDFEFILMDQDGEVLSSGVLSRFTQLNIPTDGNYLLQIHSKQPSYAVKTPAYISITPLEDFWGQKVSLYTDADDAIRSDVVLVTDASDIEALFDADVEAYTFTSDDSFLNRNWIGKEIQLIRFASDTEADYKYIYNLDGVSIPEDVGGALAAIVESDGVTYVLISETVFDLSQRNQERIFLVLGAQVDELVQGSVIQEFINSYGSILLLVTAFLVSLIALFSLWELQSLLHKQVARRVYLLVVGIWGGIVTLFSITWVLNIFNLLPVRFSETFDFFVYRYRIMYSESFSHSFGLFIIATATPILLLWLIDKPRSTKIVSLLKLGRVRALSYINILGKASVVITTIAISVVFMTTLIFFVSRDSVFFRNQELTTSDLSRSVNHILGRTEIVGFDIDFSDYRITDSKKIDMQNSLSPFIHSDLYALVFTKDDGVKERLIYARGIYKGVRLDGFPEDFHIVSDKGVDSLESLGTGTKTIGLSEPMMLDYYNYHDQGLYKLHNELFTQASESSEALQSQMDLGLIGDASVYIEVDSATKLELEFLVRNQDAATDELAYVLIAPDGEVVQENSQYLSEGVGNTVDLRQLDLEVGDLPGMYILLYSTAGTFAPEHDYGLNHDVVLQKISVDGDIYVRPSSERWAVTQDMSHTLSSGDEVIKSYIVPGGTNTKCNDVEPASSTVYFHEGCIYSSSYTFLTSSPEISSPFAYTLTPPELSDTYIYRYYDLDISNLVNIVMYTYREQPLYLPEKFTLKVYNP